jgi:hypothetical protein
MSCILTFDWLTELYTYWGAVKNDKRDDFNFPIVNFPFICSNIPAAPAYGLYTLIVDFYDWNHKFIKIIGTSYFVFNVYAFSLPVKRPWYNWNNIESTIKQLYPNPI